MTAKKPSIIFFGNERLATSVTTTAPTLSALISRGYQIKAVVTNYHPAPSRKLRRPEIESIAEKRGIPVFMPEKPIEIKDKLQELQATIGILVAYGKIVPQAIIDSFPAGIVNLHPSLLPVHRGPTPIESVILAGEKQTGVSIMQLAKAMDAGPVFAQQKINLTGHESKQQLATRLLELGKELLIENLAGIITGNLQATPQDDTHATYDQLIHKDQSKLDWQKSAHQLEREVRAFLGWPGSRTVLGNKEVTITQASVVKITGKPGQLIIRDSALFVCAKHDTLEIQKLKPAGKTEMTAEAFLSGYADKL